MDLMYELRNDPIPGQWVIVAKTSRTSFLDYLVDDEKSDYQRLGGFTGFEWGTGFYILNTSPEEGAKYLKEV